MEDVYYEDELTEAPKEEPADEEEKTSVELGKPYLKTSDLNKGDPEKEVALLEWLNYLSSEYEMGELVEVLSYYVDLGWISEKVRSELVSYIRAFGDTKTEPSFSKIQMGDKDYQLEEKRAEDESYLEDESGGKTKFKEHMKSLLFIFKILKDKIPEEIYDKISKKIESKPQGDDN
ncbi:hypothetical protein AKJ51_02335 [candidate division MSBL1 archaeon SCGC-AAA382A20]|uniref:Archaeal flagella protein FlaD/E domain-containing protein n=1 Tax=candidate division MSBL1 archaeon SCGC-AAA382A20 TaxID=1698280 RepID=A0A133VKM7_9EURY|nr:hypothetical protein AKJ51_02335 [candidate division MSBL1 archaeon SCGC-AAA382A20]